jgi:uncharacterized protein (DUF362 family)
MKKNQKHTTNLGRRNFIKTSGCFISAMACSSVLASCVRPTTTQYDALPVRSGYRPQVSSAWIEKAEEDGYDIFRQMVENATDFSWLEPGDSVFLKLSLNSGNPFPATTDPWSLACMIRLLKEKGAGEIVAGDQSGAEYVVLGENSSRGSSRSLCESAGLLRVIVDNDITPRFFEEYGWESYRQTTPSTPQHWNTPVYLTTAIDDMDHIIFLPRVGSHVIGDYSSAMKLAIGFLRDDSRLEFHQGGDDFYAMYEEINSVEEIKSKLRLTVTSGRQVLSTIGPDLGHISNPDYGLVFASEDILANEVLGYAWLHWNYEFSTPPSAQVTEQITKRGSSANDFLVTLFNQSGISNGNENTPDIPVFESSNIYCHPAIRNHMERNGGAPENIIWDQINQHPDTSVTAYLNDKMSGTAT